MKILKAIYQRLLIDAMSGLSMGLFATVIVGTILGQIGTLVGGEIGNNIQNAAMVMRSLMGVGVGIGVASKLSSSPVTVASAAVVGYIGAYSNNLFSGTLLANASLNINDSGEPLTAFVAAYIAVEASRLVAGRTKIDYILTPLLSISVGTAIGMYIGHPVSNFMKWLGGLLNWSMNQDPVIMGMIIAVLMGMSLTLPISSIALAMALNLSGQAAGAAAIGCCVNMVGFAAASFRDNKFEGFLLQSIGTSTLQMPNIVKNPVVFVPVIATSAVLGPVSICIFKITSTMEAAGLGSCGFLAQIATYQTMISNGISRNTVLIEIMLTMFVLPAIMAWVISEALRKKGFIKDNDMKIAI